MSTPIQNLFWILIKIPPVELVVLPKGVFIKTQVLNLTIGDIILPKIISPLLGQEFDYFTIFQFDNINSFYSLNSQVKIVFRI